MATTKKTAKKSAKKAPRKKAAKKAVRKSKATKTTKANGKPRASADLHPMKLTGMMAMKYRALHAELTAAQAEHKRAQDKVKNEQDKKVYQPLLILLEQQAETQQEVTRSMEALARHQIAVAQKFGVPKEKLHEYTIDPATGVMLHDPPKEKPGTAS